MCALISESHRFGQKKNQKYSVCMNPLVLVKTIVTLVNSHSQRHYLIDRINIKDQE